MSSGLIPTPFSYRLFVGERLHKFIYTLGRGGPSRTIVTVTPPGGPAVSGNLVHLDDFNVSLRDGSGEYHSWKRTPELKVVKSDPFQAHIELLDKYTDKNMHDIVAYLETLK
jgi:hypothetical protein